MRLSTRSAATFTIKSQGNALQSSTHLTAMRSPDPESIQCPHCGEVIDIPVETDGSPGSFVIDCSVCCRPIVVHVEIADDGMITMTAERESD